MRKLTILFSILFLLVLAGCGSETDRSSFYQPEEHADNDYEDPESEWSFSHCIETEHFYVFWAKEFGDDPKADSLPEDMRVDVKDLSEKAEQFYQTNVETLGMMDGDLPYGYKMQIYLLYDTDWVATGAGYDDKIGALWVSPMTCKPVGSVIAHEIGHCFQYLVYVKNLENGEEDDYRSGFRYGYAENAGNALWEIGAQWQSWQDYPREMFTDYEMDTWFDNYQRTLENEFSRYQNYWWFYYITEKHGMEAYSRIWQESVYPEDAFLCYMRLYLDNDLNAFYEEMYEYAAKAATFDFEASRPYADDFLGRYDTMLYKNADGWQQVSYADAPEANGFSVVPLKLKAGADTVTVEFQGLAPSTTLASDDPGLYCIGDEYSEENLTGTISDYGDYTGTPGWRYGFVCLDSDGNRTYSPMYSEDAATVTFTVPEHAEYVYFVVLAAPEEYVCHVWDNDESTDVKMPFEIRVTSE